MGDVDPSGARAALAPKLVIVAWPFADAPILMSFPAIDAGP